MKYLANYPLLDYYLRSLAAHSMVKKSVSNLDNARHPHVLL